MTTPTPAQIEEQTISNGPWDKGYHAGFHAGRASIEKATIERCAQVAESFHAYDRPANEIAAAIRKLKDEQ